MKIEKLIYKIKSSNINKQIDITDLNEINLVENIQNKIPNNIYIENYKLELVELKINKKCINCSRNSMYTDNINHYCWIHCQI